MHHIINQQDKYIFDQLFGNIKSKLPTDCQSYLACGLVWFESVYSNYFQIGQHAASPINTL